MEKLINEIDFQGFKKLTPEERDYFVFLQLSKIDDITLQLMNGKKNFAAKWVEHAMKYGIMLIVTAVIVAVLAKAGLHSAPAIAESTQDAPVATK